jgi:hypothetical protein
MMHEKWHDYAPLTLEVLDPYGDHKNVERLDSFEACGLLVLDCMGYSSATQHLVRDRVGKPVLLAQEVLAHAVELLAGG